MNKVPYTLTTLAEVQSAVNVDEHLFVDTETDKLYGTVRLAQFYQVGWDSVLMVERPEIYSLTAFLGTTRNVAHNIHYEVTVCQQNTDTRFIPDRMEDTFLLARLAFPEKEKFSLDEVMGYCLGTDPYKQQGLKKSELQKSNWSQAKLSEDQLLYAAADVYYLPAVLDKVIKCNQDFSYKLDMLTLVYCLDFQWNGVPLHKSRFFEKYDEVSNNVNTWMEQCPVNVNSWKQVREWLQVDRSGDLDLAEFELDPNYPDRERMCYFGNVGMKLHEAAGLIRKIRKERKKLSFLDKFEATVKDGSIYGKFKPSARSGRLTSDDQNLQQLPRSLKCVFGVEEDQGEILLYSDYAQIELRHICAITECRTMEKLFREGLDLHTYTADMIFGDLQSIIDNRVLELHSETEEQCLEEAKKIYKRNRQISKTCNFSLLYGGGITMFIGILIQTANLVISEVEANKTRAKWRNLWREIYAWQERGIAAWRKGRLGSTPAGRKYSAKMMTDQLNIENQGGAADVNKLAMHYLVPKLRAYNEEHGTSYRIANNIHDSFILRGEDQPEHYKAVGEIMAREMQRAWFECSKLLKIKDLPMPVQVIAGYNWGDIETDDFEHPWTFELPPYEMLEANNG